MTTKFCIKHQKLVEIENKDITGHKLPEGHIAALFAPDWGWCGGPFASCPPPELPEDWELDAVPPSPAELVEMDASADELLSQVLEEIFE